MKHYDVKEISRLVDISAVTTSVTYEEIATLIEVVKRYQFIAAFVLPANTHLLIDGLRDEKLISVGGVVGFPSGGELTEGKVFTARGLREMGCGELDMVLDVSALKSKNYRHVFDDISAVVKEAGDLPVKVILETSYLSDAEILEGCKIVADSGAAFVKTGTGWGSKPTTVANIELIYRTVGDRVKIKAAGGVRSLELLEAMADAGCSRFGIGVGNAVSILGEAVARDGLVLEELF